jgi:hypothetical protein
VLVVLVFEPGVSVVERRFKSSSQISGQFFNGLLGAS